MKTTEELIEEFLANGGEIEKLEAVEPEYKSIIGSTVKKTPELKTLAEGELLYGEKQKRRTKKKVPDFSGINLDLIQKHLHDFIKKEPAESKEGDNKGDTASETN